MERFTAIRIMSLSTFKKLWYFQTHKIHSQRIKKSYDEVKTYSATECKKDVIEVQWCY